MGSVSKRLKWLQASLLRLYIYGSENLALLARHGLIMATPADETETTSLTQRAPVELVPSETWQLWIRPALIFVIPAPWFIWYVKKLEQKNPCIRSQLGGSSWGFKWKLEMPTLKGPNMEAIVEGVTATSFPYPYAYGKLLKSHPQRRVLETRNFSSGRIFSWGYSQEVKTGSVPDEENRSCNFADNALSEHNLPAKEEDSINKMFQVRGHWLIPVLGFTRTLAVKREIQIQPTYVVLGIFSHGRHNPQERVVFVSNPKNLFWELRWAIFRLRGLSNALFSLRQVRSFRLYRVSTA